MFLEEFVHVLDEKGRLTIPAKFRAGLSDGLVITRGIDRCLVVYPLEEWNRLAERVSALPMTNRSARAFRRLVFAGAHHATPDKDKQGRVLIPPRLREYANLEGEVVIAGLNTHIEIWNPEAWAQEREHIEEDEDAVDEWANLGI